MKNNRNVLIFWVLGLLCLGGLSAFGAELSYRPMGEIHVGGDGGWDYLSVDAAARRLYVTHATQVVAIDLDRAVVVGKVEDAPGVHGFAIAPELHRGYSSNGRESRVSVVDLATLQTLAKVPTGENPDAIVYEPGRREVYAFNGRSHSATVIETASNTVVATIALPGKPEFAAVDSELGRVYCNIEDQNAVVVLDSRTHQIIQTWPTTVGEEPAGLAMDPITHRLFIGCHNNRMLMMNATNGAIVATVPIGTGVDATAFDPETHLVFNSCGDGTVTIAREESSEKLTIIQTLTTERGARTMTWDPRTHRIYLASARYEAQVGTPVAGQRPKIISDSLKILVYGTEPLPDHETK